MKVALGKPWTIVKKQQKPYGAQKPRMAVNKSVKSILPVTLSLSPEQLGLKVVPLRWFIP